MYHQIVTIPSDFLVSDLLEHLKEKEDELKAFTETAAVFSSGSRIGLDQPAKVLRGTLIMINYKQFRRDMQIFVKCLDGKTITIVCTPGSFTEDIKKQIEEKTDIKWSQQRLFGQDVI